MRKPLIVGNWKMHTGRDEAARLARETGAAASDAAARVDVGVAPPFVWLSTARESAGRPLAIYAQNCSAHPSGAHTGEISLAMLADVGVTGVILGHSERRHVYGETDAEIRDKVHAAIAAGFHVILCVGETLSERQADETWAVVKRQLETATEGLGDARSLAVAYEPVWAIGTGETATPDQAQAVHAQIRAWWAERFNADAAAALRIQYGGSVKPGNAAALLSQPDVDGALVGGASLDAASFAAIIAAS